MGADTMEKGLWDLGTTQTNRILCWLHKTWTEFAAVMRTPSSSKVKKAKRKLSQKTAFFFHHLFFFSTKNDPKKNQKAGLCGEQVQIFCPSFFFNFHSPPKLKTPKKQILIQKIKNKKREELGRTAGTREHHPANLFPADRQRLGPQVVGLWILLHHLLTGSSNPNQNKTKNKNFAAPKID